jgi:hypothetical protein
MCLGLCSSEMPFHPFSLAQSSGWSRNLNLDGLRKSSLGCNRGIPKDSTRVALFPTCSLEAVPSLLNNTQISLSSGAAHRGVLASLGQDGREEWQNGKVASGVRAWSCSATRQLCDIVKGSLFKLETLIWEWQQSYVAGLLRKSNSTGGKLGESTWQSACDQVDV